MSTPGRPVSPLCPEDKETVQRVVLFGDRRHFVQHVAVSFAGHPAGGRAFLASQAAQVTPASQAKAVLQRSVGLSFTGLERLALPPQLLALLRAKAPAFSMGAVVRAGAHLGDTGASRASTWEPAYVQGAIDAVLSLQSIDRAVLDEALRELHETARCCDITLTPFVAGEPLLDAEGQVLVHFGYRDGLSRVAIRGHERDQGQPAPHADVSVHAPGEFLLGHRQDNGANPWALSDWPAKLRSVFRNGSFGVLRQMAQDEKAFEAFLDDQVRKLQLAGGLCKKNGQEMSGPELREFVKAKLAGRWPNGARIDPADDLEPPSDGVRGPSPFTYQHDKEGHGCPFGAHARRLNPRGADVAHSVRTRPVLRRGSAYGPRYAADPNAPRGLLGWFFCSSIEEQFEHVLGQWADRVPLGSPDEGNAKDPLHGEHEAGGGRFHIPRPGGGLWLTGFKPFVRTRGTVYLFYPSTVGLRRIVEDDWLERDRPS